MKKTLLIIFAIGIFSLFISCSGNSNNEENASANEEVSTDEDGNLNAAIDDKVSNTALAAEEELIQTEKNKQAPEKAEEKAGLDDKVSEQSENTVLEKKKADPVNVYYFHYKRRCLTCRTVEDESKKIVRELYGDNVGFASIDLEEEEGQQLAEKLDVQGQTLLITDGKAMINITNEGFMYAKSNPDKLKNIIKEKTDPLL